MNVFLATILVLAALACPVFGQDDDALHLHYSLTEGSNMILFPLNRPPRFRRSLFGTFDVIVKERLEEGFVFEIVYLRFQSIEDDLYEVQAETGVLTFRHPDISLTLTMSVNGEADDYSPGMIGADRELLATTWPPVFRNLILVGQDFRAPYWVHVFAEAFCPADCNQDGASTINELLVCLNVALGLADPGTCPTCDLNGDGDVSIDEVVVSVDTVLHGCR
jgi:hypothetical protein